MKKEIFFATPDIGSRERDAVMKVLESRWVTQGPQVGHLESEFSQYTGALFSCAVSNATAALYLALKAAGVGRGDEVVTTSHSFVATANVIRWLEAIPVFVDIDPGTFNLDPNKLEEGFSNKTKAVIAVHQMGMPAAMNEILAVTKPHGITVIEDAACAAGSEYLDGEKWRHIGYPFGEAVCFSMHPRKLMCAGDGGLITTNNSNWSEKFRLWRHHGMNLTDSERHRANQILDESYVEPGYNFRLTDLQAAMARVQLARLNEFVEKRHMLLAEYENGLSDYPEFRFPEKPSWARWNCQSLCVILPETLKPLEVRQALRDQGIHLKSAIRAIHRFDAYPAGTWRSPHPLTHTEWAEARGVLLPMHSGLSATDVEEVCAALIRLYRK